MDPAKKTIMICNVNGTTGNGILMKAPIAVIAANIATNVRERAREFLTLLPTFLQKIVRFLLLLFLPSFEFPPL